MTHVVDALGRDKGPDLDRIALAMVDVATKVGSDEAVSITGGISISSLTNPSCLFQVV